MNKGVERERERRWGHCNDGHRGSNPNNVFGVFGYRNRIKWGGKDKKIMHVLSIFR